MNYEIGLIFIDDDDYSNKTQWCSANGFYIEEIEPNEDGTRQFKICAIPEPVVPTLDELKQQINVLRENKIVELENYRSYLRNTETASYDNDSFLIRQEDQNNMNTYYARAIAMKMGVVPSDTFALMSVTNTSHTFTPDQIIELSKIMYAKVEEIYQRHWYAQNVLLANALTAEEINAVQIPLSL